MSDQPTSNDQEFEGDLKAYFGVTSSTELPGGVQRMDAGKYSDAKPPVMRRVMSGTGLLLVAAVAVGAVVTLRGTSSHPTPSLAATPSIMSGAAIAYDPAIKKVVLFGGSNANGQDLADTWTWDGTAWTLLSTATSPPARENAALGWDPASQQLVMTGGTNTTALQPETCTKSSSVPPSLPPGAVVSGGSGGAVSGQASGGVVVSGGSGSGFVSSVSGSSGAPALSPGTAASGSISISGSGIVSKGIATCTTSSGAALSDTWTFDGTTWHQEHPATKPSIAFGRTLMATDNTTGSLVLVTPSFSPPALNTTSRACPDIAPSAVAGVTTACASLASPTNDVYVWRNGNWVSNGTLSGDITALATDPSTGDVTAVLSPEIAFSCGAVASTNATTSAAIAVAPCPVSAEAEKTTAPRGAALKELTAGSWTTVGATGAPTAQIISATSDSGADYLLVLTADGQTWSFAHNTWTRLAASGPPIGAIGLALLADDPAAANTAAGQVLMFVPAPGMAPAGNGSAALIPVQPLPAQANGATSDAVWVWTGSWKQVSGGPWPTPSTTDLPAPASCPAAAAGTSQTPPPGAVITCSISGSAASGPTVLVQPTATPTP